MTQRTVSVVLFDGFELLDVFGPVELLSVLRNEFSISFLGPTPQPVPSSQGVTVNATQTYADAEPADILLVPGGMGTRALVDNKGFLDWLHDHAAACQIVTSVCTGSALLAAAGLLDGYRATSNKWAFTWAAQHGEDVTWVPQARWVEDRDRWTSSGVAAGMDMTAALIRSLLGADTAQRASDFIELDVQTDPTHDRFAALYGL
ncbi:MAG: DJ-1/PfpI family protein [Gordonia sp. (in: high G+C Gram-positive bacteria)]